ncbi:hypothetical protein [Paraburkholderia fungorum]|uniref:Uncharacterized protein n=1 Tax=Paraburkholderia fungorum TaxID=134537 RepID=A0A3R7HHW7_9BURK|nr:hypothetical protein [Paraburkholderia fungorum]RKF46710.1 hypothetical protein BCY88_03675 [Paraburkholderia fungorum]
MQYVFSMTTRMVTIVLVCAMALCVLLFLLGIEIGVRYMAPAKVPSTSPAPASAAAMVEQAPIAADAGSESVVRSVSDPAGASPAPASSNN